MYLSRGVRLIDMHSSGKILCDFDYYLAVVICRDKMRYNRTVMESFRDMINLMKTAKFINKTA